MQNGSGVNAKKADDDRSTSGNSMLNPTFVRTSSNSNNAEKRPSTIKTYPGKLIVNYSFKFPNDLGTWFSCLDMKSSRYVVFCPL